MSEYCTSDRATVPSIVDTKGPVRPTSLIDRVSIPSITVPIRLSVLVRAQLAILPRLVTEQHLYYGIFGTHAAVCASTTALKCRHPHASYCRPLGAWKRPSCKRANRAATIHGHALNHRVEAQRKR
jgi:hypothetical protein